MILVILQDPDNASNPTSLEGALAENNAAIKEAFKKALSRDGADGTNFMLSDLDMNNFRILNAKTGTGSNDLVTRKQVGEIKAGLFRKNSTTGDLEYQESDNATWTVLYTAADLKGDAGAGNGDLEAANNLSDVDSALTSRENLGLEIGVDVLAYDASLATFDPSTKADLTDSRFERFVVEDLTSSSTLSSFGRLYRMTSVSATALTLNTGTDGGVSSVYVTSGSGNVTLTAGSGVSIFVSGEVVSRNPVVAAGGHVTITCVASDGNSYLVSGTGIQPA